MDLGEFLLARFGEDEAVAQAATPGRWRWSGGTWNFLNADGDEGQRASVVASDAPLDVSVSDEQHIARHDPARVLADCDAKRRIVAKYLRRGELIAEPEHAPMRGLHENDRSLLDYVLRDLALPYADHPDYDESWRPN